MYTLFAILVITVEQSLCACPHEDATLQSFGDLYPNLQKSDEVKVTESVLLDVDLVDVTKITISGSGKLVFDRNINITVKTTGILVQDQGALVIGSFDCRHEDRVNIVLEGDRSADQSQVGDTGEKYIAVTDDGELHIHGADKLSWTKLDATVDRIESFVEDNTKVKFIHSKSKNDGFKKGREGPAVYIVDTDATVLDFSTYDFSRPDKLTEEQEYVNSLITDLDNVNDGQLVALSTQNFFKPNESTHITPLFDKLEEVSGMANGELLLRDLEEYDAYSLIFVKGGSQFVQAADKLISKTTTYTLVSLEFAGYKISASSYIVPGIKYESWTDFRILDPSVGYPVINVIDDISSWNVGDEVLITSTDYHPAHGEVRKIKEILSATSFKLSDELIYRHFGEIEDRVDMRAEVALLTHNIKIEGAMSRGCPPSNGNCDRVDFDTFGGHLKIFHSFGAAHIQGAEFYHMGQGTQKGTYPIHYHMLLNITGQAALVQGNSIHHTLQRCLTVHGTYGTSVDQPGVEVKDNVAYDAFGHCFFLEDGIEVGTILTGNLGAYVRSIDNGFFTTDMDPSVYWITNPKVLMIGNVAAGCEGFGIWYSFPYEPVGPSAGMVYKYNEAIQTRLWTCDNNVVHSNIMGGFHFEKIILDNDGNVDHHLKYTPLVDPLDSESDAVKVQIMRLTAYKNRKRNVWARGGLEFMQFSGTIKTQQFLKKSVFIGESKGNAEEDGYPDAYPPAKLKYRLAIGFIYGPQYISDSWFTGFKSADDGTYVSGALSFKPVSVLTGVFGLRFGFNDAGEDGTSVRLGAPNRFKPTVTLVTDRSKATEGNRMFVGSTGDLDLGFMNENGNEISTVRDLDGSLTACTPSEDYGIKQVVKPEKFLLTPNCRCREKWRMCICDEAFGSALISVREEFTIDVPDAIQTKRLNYQDPEDVAYEDHFETNDTRGRASVVLGDDMYYYQLQMTGGFPKRIDLEIDGGVESGQDVVIGLCLPEGTTKDDMTLKARSGSDVYVTNDNIIWADTLQEVRDDDTMATVFLDGRFLYLHFTSTEVRDPYTDTHKCLATVCPVFHITWFEERPYTLCFNPSPEEFDTDNMLSTAPKETCDFAASDPEPDWGTGDTTASQDGAWGDWVPLSECSAGVRQIGRVCDSPTPFGGGQDCVGPSIDTESCE